MTLRLTNTLIRSNEDCPNRQPIRNYQFVSPPNEVKSMKFRDPEELRGYLLRQQSAIGGRVTTMYRYNCQPKVENCTHIRVRCNYCPARLALRLEAGMFVVTRLNNQHCHEELAFDSKLEEDIFRYYRDMARREWEKKRVKIEVRTTGRGVDRLLHFQNRELLHENQNYNTWQLLSKQLKNKGYEYKVEWGSQPYGPYPRMIVLVSKLMRCNYQNYSELLSFDFTYNLIKNRTSDGKRYGLGVFCVTDTNVRVLITGVSIMCQERNEDLYRMFKYFFELHGGLYPQTIITDQQKTMEVGLEMLVQRNRYSGIHIYDPFHMVNHIRESVRGEEEAMRQSVRIVSKMIRCRTLTEYQECNNLLTKDLDNAPLFSDFMSKAHKVCHFEIPRSFIGINRFSCEIVNDLIKTEVPHQTTINRLIERIVGLDGRLHLKSAEGFDIYNEPIEQQLSDPRVKEVRMSFEKKVFSRFLENYTKSLSGYEVLEQEVQTHSSKIQMCCSQTGELFSVDHNWCCNCDELSKTGVPCPHLIICARLRPEKSYTELFNQRWRKKVPVLSHDEIVWTKKKFTRCERYYIPRRNRSAKVYYAVVSDQEDGRESDDND